ncbi:MAG TPA: hypothetical protein VGA36_04625, partial [Nitriliruptorales bacterium]
AAALRVIEEYANATPPPDAHVGDDATTLARLISTRRFSEAADRFEAGCWSTAEVVERVTSMSGRAAVAARRDPTKRASGHPTLLGVNRGNTTLHPDWQFNAADGTVREGIEPVVSALHGSFQTVEGADEFMRTPHLDLAGHTPADAFARGYIDPVVVVIRRAGDQS